MPTYLLLTFGCKSNQYESQAIRESLDRRGAVETTDPAGADLLIVNTCGVTGRAGASCRNAIRRALRANPAARLVVTGCGVDLKEKWLDNLLPEETPLLIPNAKKYALAELLVNPENSPVTEAQEGAASGLAAFPENRFAAGIGAFHGHTRAFLKIQDGCDNFCSYCAVPHARGRPESRPAGDILAEAERLTANGHRELVLTGINIGAYARPGLRLPDLVDKLADTPGLVRLRLGSVEPPHLDFPLVEVMRERAGVVCPHLHLPLQSGDGRILALMGRRYGPEEFLEKLELLRDNLERPAVTTDLIVGFPGEDETAAANTLAFCRRAAFSRLHVFLFSPRPGTPAAALPRTAGDRDIEAWKNRLLGLGKELAAGFARSTVGTVERIIVENNGGGFSDRYVRVTLPGGVPGAIELVRIRGAAGEGTVGEKVDNPV